jgi:hypothetical protein
LESEVTLISDEWNVRMWVELIWLWLATSCRIIPRNGGWFLRFFFSVYVWAGSGAHPASSNKGYLPPFPGRLKRPGRDNHPPQVRNELRYTSLHLCLHGTLREDLHSIFLSHNASGMPVKTRELRMVSYGVSVMSCEFGSGG